jgi:hypothetical protein
MSTAFGLTLILGLMAQAKEPADDSKDDGAPARLAFMKGSVKAYNVHPIEASSASFQLQAEPIFRLNNAVSGVKDGAIFLWTNEVGRPEAAIQVFRVLSGDWVHEFTSLSTAPFVAEVGSKETWHPAKPGLEFQKVPDAPRPGATPEQRLRQMRELAQDFSADDHFESKGWNSLRLLSKALVRYGKTGTTVEDGALFGFVLGTDPEVFLMLEARTGKDGLEWQYALAPMTCYQVKAAWKGKPVWSLPLRLPAKDTAGTFYDADYSQRP